MYTVSILNITVQEVYTLQIAAGSRGAAIKYAVTELKSSSYLERGMAWEVINAEKVRH